MQGKKSYWVLPNTWLQFSHLALQVAGSHAVSAGVAPALASHVPESAGAGQSLTSVWRPLTCDRITPWAATLWQEVLFSPFLAIRKKENHRISRFHRTLGDH